MGSSLPIPSTLITINNCTSEAKIVMNGLTSNYLLDDLSPYQQVSVQITANTSAGEGPRSTISHGRTDPAGIIVSHNL